MRSYTTAVCGDVTIGVTIGEEVTVNCEATTEQYQYIIVQSLDTRAEELCIAEVCAYEGGMYAISFVVISCSNNATYYSLLKLREPHCTWHIMMFNFSFFNK